MISELVLHTMKGGLEAWSEVRDLQRLAFVGIDPAYPLTTDEWYRRNASINCLVLVCKGVCTATPSCVAALIKDAAQVGGKLLCPESTWSVTVECFGGSQSPTVSMQLTCGRGAPW